MYKPSEKYLKIIEEMKAEEGTSDEKFGLMEVADQVDCAEAVLITGIPDSATDDDNLAGVDPPDEGDDSPPLEESSVSDNPGDDVDSDVYINLVNIDKDDLNVVMQQVKTNKLGVTDCQVEQAYRDWELYHMCVAPTVAKFKLLLKTGFLHNLSLIHI